MGLPRPASVRCDSELAGARTLVIDPTGGGGMGFLSRIRFFRPSGSNAHGFATDIVHASSAGKTSSGLDWERIGAQVFSRGETCQKLGGFHQLRKGLRGGWEDGWESDFADLVLCSSAACGFPGKGRMASSRSLPLMKTTRFLAGPPDILCASGNWGSVRRSTRIPVRRVHLFGSLYLASAASRFRRCGCSTVWRS